MNWIKDRYDQAALLVLAIVLLIVSGLLITRALSFEERYEEVRRTIPKSTEVETVETVELEDAVQDLQQPALWTVEKGEGSLFVARGRLLVDGKLIAPGLPGSPQIFDEIPNEWILDRQPELDFRDPDLPARDPDGDYFSTLEEYRAGTEPLEAESHPPYPLKLRLQQYIAVPFRLKFSSYDGDPKNPEGLTFFINTIDLRQPTQLLKLGDPIKGTKFKLVDFEHKTRINPATRGVEDVSELVAENVETNERVKMVLGREVDSPTSFGVFNFLPTNFRFRVKQRQSFALPPEPKKLYKLVEISENEAVIQALESEKTYKIPKM